LVRLRSILHRLYTWPISPAVTRWIGRVFWGIGVPTGGEDSASLTDADSILVIRLDRIGDFVLSTSFLRELRRNAPKARLTLVVSADAYNLAETCPYVDEVIAVDTARVNPYRRWWRVLVFARRRLAAGKYDLCILPRRGIDRNHATYLAFFSGSTRRVGFSERVHPLKCAWNRGYDRLLTDSILDAVEQHEVEHNLGLLSHLGALVENGELELWWSEDDTAHVDRFIERNGFKESARIAAIAPCASDERKVWPPEGFIGVGKWLMQAYNTSLVVVGGECDRDLACRFVEELGPDCASAAGELTLRQTAALLARCMVFVGNDSGPMHLAAAVKRPVVEICWFDPVDPSDDLVNANGFHPWGTPHEIVYPSGADVTEGGERSRLPVHRVRSEDVRSALKSCLERLPSSG